MFLLEIEWNPIKYIDLGFFKLHFYSLMWIVAFVIGFQIMKPVFKKEGEKNRKGREGYFFILKNERAPIFYFYF